MTTSENALGDLLQQALSLPDDSRLLLAEELVASVNASGQDGDEVVVARRRAEFLSGAATLIPADEALRQVREELAARHVRREQGGWLHRLSSPSGI